LVDVVRLFIKNEPHKKSKIESGFLRLISNVSVVDELIDRLLFSSQNEIEVDSWLDIPSKPGIGFTDDMMQSLSDEVFTHAASTDICEGDASSWDWTIQHWELEAEADMRVRLLRLPSTSNLARLIRNRIYCVSRSVYALSSGELFAQLDPGLMLSGWYCTSSSNSRLGRLACVLSGADWSIHMGDDFISDDVPLFKERFEKLGHILKLYKRVEGTFEFCSTNFPSFSPVNVWKIFVKLLSNGAKSYSERVGLYYDWCYDMRHHPSKNELGILIQASGFLDSDQLGH
jgi:hypothetical protein